MKYKFSDINNNDFYSSGSVIIITGPYSVFNNMVIDRVKQQNKSKISTANIDKDLLARWGYSAEDDMEALTSVDYGTFIDNVAVPNINGKWVCNVDYNFMTKKQKESFVEYIKKPSINGVLIVTINEYADYRQFLKHKVIESSRTCHLIQLSFPVRNILIDIVKDLFNKRNVSITDKSAELFIMRMSSSYDEYDTLIDNICLNRQNSTIEYAEMVEELKGQDNYVLDDLLNELLKDGDTTKIKAGKQIYKMLDALIDDMSAQDLVRKLRYKIDDYIELRLAINSGIIPTKIRYSLEDVRARIEKYLGSESKLLKISDFTFRKQVFIASRTSLADWACMKFLLTTAGNNRGSFKEKEELAKKALFSVVHRTSYNKSRLYNAMRFENILEHNLFEIDSTPYLEEYLNGFKFDSEEIGVGDE